MKWVRNCWNKHNDQAAKTAVATLCHPACAWGDGPNEAKSPAHQHLPCTCVNTANKWHLRHEHKCQKKTCCERSRLSNSCISSTFSSRRSFNHTAFQLWNHLLKFLLSSKHKYLFKAKAKEVNPDQAVADPVHLKWVIIPVVDGWSVWSINWNIQTRTKKSPTCMRTYFCQILFTTTLPD